MPAANKDQPKAPAKDAPKEVGRYAYEGLQRLIHEKARLSILASLASHARGLLFNDLKALCSLTDGNLSRQLQVLQEAGFVEVWKGFKNKRPQTLCRLTPDGRRRFIEYITTLENVVSDAMSAAEHEKTSTVPRSPEAEGFVPA
jgi:DNA-binding HxlR family transcriptional regulator